LGVDDALVDFLDVFEVKVDEAAEFLGGGVAVEEIEGHAAGEEGEEVWAVGEGVGLAVAGELEAVFEVAEEEVGGGEAGVFGVGEEVFVAEADEGEKGGGIAEPGGAAAVDALEALDEEFDIADAAPGEFDIEALRAAAGVEFLVDAFAGFGHGLDGGEVEGGGVDHGLDPLEEVAARGAFAGGDAGLEEHLEFPVAGAGAVVLFGGIEGDADLAEAAIGAEAEVDAVAKAFGGVGGEEVREAGGDFLEEFEIGDGVFAVGLAIALIEEEEVDVRAVVEFVGSEFTEGEDGEAALVAGGEAWGAVAGDEVEAEAAVGDVEQGVGDVGEFVGDFGEGGEAEDIAEEDAEDLAAAETGEADGFGDAVGGGEPALEFSHHFDAGTDAVKPAGFEDGEEPVGILEDLLGEEVGGGEDGKQGLESKGDGGDVLEVAGVAVTEAFSAEECGVGVGGLGEKDLEAGAEFGGDGAKNAVEGDLFTLLFGGGGLVQQSGLSPRRRCRGRGSDGKAGQLKDITLPDETWLQDGGIKTAARPAGGGGVSGFGEGVHQEGLNAMAGAVVGVEGGAGLAEFGEFEDGGAGAELHAGAELAEVEALDGEILAEVAGDDREAGSTEEVQIIEGDEEEGLEGAAVVFLVALVVAVEAEGTGEGLGDSEFGDAAGGEADLMDDAAQGHDAGRVSGILRRGGVS
jgi:hypothetical protein